MVPIEKYLKRALVGFIAAVHPPRRIAPSALPTKYFKRILVVKQHDQLGDLLVATPAIRALRKRFPEAFIAVVVREYNAPIMWENPYVDSVIMFYEKLNRWNFRKFKTIWNQLRGDGGYDCAIVLNSVSRSLSSDLIAVVSKAKYIVGPNHIALDSDISESIYSTLTHRSRKLQPESEHYLDIMRQIGVHPDGVDYDLLLEEDEIREADRILYHSGIQSNSVLLGVHLGALNKEKRLPIDRLVKVIEWVKKQYACQILVMIGPHDAHVKDELLSHLDPKTVIVAPLVSLRIASGIIKKLTLLLCNDTGPMHIASAMEVPTVSFHSISDPVQWKPPHERHIAIRAEDKKIGSITVEMITAEIKKQFDILGVAPKSF
ncbi:MAG: glycosyltransferase family 9 protein [Bacteroidota bacterium]